MDSIRQQIACLVTKLQLQSTIPLWALANEKLAYAIATGKVCAWGPKSNILFKLMRMAFIFKVADFVIFSVGFVRVVSLWLQVTLNHHKSPLLTPIKRVFAGFGACSEEYLYNDFINQSTLPALRICLVTYRGLCHLPCPSFWNVFKIVMQYSFGHTAKINASIPEISSHAVDFLTICALNIGSYAFYRAYWKLAKSHGVEEVTFLAADIPAFACIDEQLTTIYQQHGLMALTILFPDFTKFYINTEDEVRYLKAMFPHNKVFHVPTKINSINHKSNTLMILSPNISISERLVEMQSLVQWAISNELQVVIRPTIKVTNAECSIIREKYPNAIMDDIKVPLNKSFEHWQPKLVASWASTGLATALDYGIIPVSLESNMTDNLMWNVMMYPMQHKVLFWPDDKGLLENALESKASFTVQTRNLRDYQDGLLLGDFD